MTKLAGRWRNSYTPGRMFESMKQFLINESTFFRLKYKNLLKPSSVLNLKRLSGCLLVCFGIVAPKRVNRFQYFFFVWELIQSEWLLAMFDDNHFNCKIINSSHSWCRSQLGSHEGDSVSTLAGNFHQFQIFKGSFVFAFIVFLRLRLKI